ncbi:MAG TPA: alpha/beta hydrolase [Bacteroidia bacterium]|nr:alpha/beta hydrolase [Bacteroidia bacterium]
MWSTPKFIEIKNPDLKIAYHDSGDVYSDTQAPKPVLFFVHGLGLSSVMWKYAVNNLVSDYRCIAIDLPGHGDSWEQRGNFSMTFYAQVLRSVIEEMKLPEITLIGHSMGGQISVIASLQMPAIVSRLVLVSAAGVETFTNEEAEKIIQGAEFFYKAPADINHILNTYTPHFSMHVDRVRELLEDNIIQQTEHFSAFYEMVIASVKGMLHEPIFAFLHHIHQPCLVLYGEKDLVIPNKWIHPLMNIQQIETIVKTKIIHSNCELIPLCGHYLPFEQPRIFAEKLHQFHLSTDN